MRYKKINDSIDKKYKDKKYRKISRICLKLGEEWTIIKEANVCLSSNIKKSRKQRKAYKKECKAYIVDNFNKSDVVGGIFLSLFLSILIKMIADWISQMIIDDIYFQN